MASGTITQASWVVIVSWFNSADTVHGPWIFAEHAEKWAGRAVEGDSACTGWRLEILQPAAT